jgi:hypothetical protein
MAIDIATVVLESGDPAFTPRVAVSWQNPEDYTRTPEGDEPVNPVTFTAAFTDESGCASEQYRFWAFDQDGTPVDGIGSVMTMEEFGVSTTATLPVGEPVFAVRLACVDGDGNPTDTSSNLESGAPAFTPQAPGECSDQNETLCEEPGSSGECETCGGDWVGRCANPYSGCATEATCYSECGWNEIPAQYDNGTCFVVGVPESECTGNGWSWLGESCFDHDADMCEAPVDEETCTACEGTWSE